jgi:type II secretion system protein J
MTTKHRHPQDQLHILSGVAKLASPFFSGVAKLASPFFSGVPKLPPHPGANGGFTLIEMLVATTMLVILSAAGFAALSAGTHAAAKAKRYNAMAARGQAALQMMADDIRAAVEYEKFTLVSLDVQTDGRDTDTIDFIVAKMPRLQQEDDVPVGRCEVGYSIANDPDSEHRWLLRREDGSVDDDPLEGGALTLAGPYVTELNLVFYDGLFWQSGWNEDELPVAVSIQLTVQDEDGQENPIVLSCTVPIMAR